MLDLFSYAIYVGSSSIFTNLSYPGSNYNSINIDEITHMKMATQIDSKLFDNERYKDT